MWENDLFEGASLCTHIRVIILYLINPAHAWLLCKSNWHLDQMFFSFPTQCCLKALRGRSARLSESDRVKWRQKSSKVFPALCGWAQIFLPSLLPILWYCLFFRVQSLATKSHITQLPLTEYVFIRMGPLSSETHTHTQTKRHMLLREVPHPEDSDLYLCFT